MGDYRKEYAKKHAAKLKEYHKRYDAEHLKQKLLWRKNHYKNSPEKDKARARKYYWDNVEERKRYTRKFVKDHADRYAAYAIKRHTLKLKAMPPWVNLKEIEKVYAEAKRLTCETGVKHAVDHIWPLRPGDNSFVGLHVPWNLRVITAAENNSKSNKRPDRG